MRQIRRYSNVEQCCLLRFTKELMKVISHINGVSLQKTIKDDSSGHASTLRESKTHKSRKRKKCKCAYLGLGNDDLENAGCSGPFGQRVH